MEIRIHSRETNRMMKVVEKCLGPEGQGSSNIEIVYDNNLLSIRATNGAFFVIASAPVMGGDGETFCVDGRTFARVCGVCNGDMVIRTDEKNCVVQGVGRTRIPIVTAKVPAFDRVFGNSLSMRGAAFQDCYRQVRHAICPEGNRLQLTGVYLETEDGSETGVDTRTLRMVALDGFQLSYEEIACAGEPVKAIIPGNFMQLADSAIAATDDVRLTFSDKQVQIASPGILTKCGLIAGEYIDYRRTIPHDFQTRCRVALADIRNALRVGNAVNNKQRLIRMSVGERNLTIENNSMEADFEANVSCETEGNGLKIAFNEKYLMDTTASIDAEYVDMGFNGPTSPMFLRWENSHGVRMLLPVRVM